MKKIRVKQIRSKIRRPKNQKLTLEALGLKKMNQEVEQLAHLCLEFLLGHNRSFLG